MTELSDSDMNLHHHAINKHKELRRDLPMLFIHIEHTIYMVT